MKPISVLKSSVFCTLFSLFLAGSTTGLLAQERSSDDLAYFVIYVERTETEIVLQCTSGCIWSRLAIPASDEKSFAINHMGMAEWDDDSEEQGFSMDKPEGDSEADKILREKMEGVDEFLFKFTPTEKGVSLEKGEGTLWKGAEFSLGQNDRWKIDIRGVGLQ